MVFKCTVLDPQGKRSVFWKTHDHQEDLVRELNRQGLTILDLKPEVASEGKNRRLSAKQVVEFVQALEVLLNQNLTLKEAFAVLTGIFPSGPLGNLTQTLSGELSKGLSFHQALKSFENSFPPLVLGLVRIGEVAGNLKKVVTQLSGYLEQRNKLREKLLGALIYPLMILFVAFAGMLLLSLFILPGFIELAESLGRGAAGDLQRQLTAFQVGSLGVFVFFTAFIILVAALSRRPDSPLKFALDRLLLSVPLVNTMILNVQIQNLVLSLEILLQSGYNLDQALQETEKVVSNAYLLATLRRVGEKVKKGVSFSRAIGTEKAFPRTFTAWVEVGEAGHDLNQTLVYLQRYYQGEIEKQMGRVMGLIEPTLILMIGIFLFFIIFNFIGPVFQLMGNAL